MPELTSQETFRCSSPLASPPGHRSRIWTRSQTRAGSRYRGLWDVHAFCTRLHCKRPGYTGNKGEELFSSALPAMEANLKGLYRAVSSSSAPRRTPHWASLGSSNKYRERSLQRDSFGECEARESSRSEPKL